MNFHTSSDFKDALEAAASKMNIRPVLIEKDYWVTLVLWNLYKSELSGSVVFKGGTSLSKAYNCIQRFSEDIDLAILNKDDLNDNQLNKLIKSVETDCSKGFEQIPDHPNVVKKGRNRTTVYKYPKVLTDNNFGAVKDVIQLEINSFTKPVPFKQASIQSYVGQFLLARGEKELVEKFGLHPFSLQVLALERTFFEKLLSINRLSYVDADSLKSKIRHFYDLFQLFNHPDLKQTILTDASFPILEQALKDDEGNATFGGKWIGKPLAASPLFSNLEAVWKELIPVYQKDLSDLVWTDLPNPEVVLAVLVQIREFVKLFDKR